MRNNQRYYVKHSTILGVRKKKQAVFYDFEAPLYVAALIDNSKQTRQVLRNNSYLLRKKGIKVKDQFKYFKSQGIKLTYDYYKSLMSGRRKTPALTVLNFFSNYWDLPLYKMISENFEIQDKLNDI